MFLPSAVVPIIIPEEGLSDETKQVILELLVVILFFACLQFWFKLLFRFGIFLYKKIKFKIKKSRFLKENKSDV